ncbi:AzlD domain-containing protein [Halobellus captivus]|uniref:AzlD domain-containing protein n=1 Tax=Halobellus captivus TaxID=2592614 RepID=UPI0011AAE195|nr:AzlD domain-containing protein [Halobellus captivus]
MPTEYGTLAVWTAIVALGLVTFGIRASFIHLFGRLEAVPDRATNALRFVPPAVFAALTVPAFIAPEGAIAVVGNERLLAGLVAAAVTWYLDDVFATIVAGMATLWILRFGF